jgi:periplasmic copper chaperone A
MVGMVALVASVGATAQVTVSGAWARGTVAAQKATGAYMILKSDQDAKVVAASSPLGNVEIHETAMANGVMQMRALPALELPKGKAVELKPNGNHMMITGLAKPLAKGDTVPITLTVEGKDGKRSTVQISAEVRPLGAGAPEHKH